jgi:metal-sulfur cluster biosynthetic enzyme
MITKEDIISVCKTIQDPEINIDIYTIGLIYDISISEQDDITILMTYTTPLCPFGGRIQEELKTALGILKPHSITINVTFNPPWKVSDELRQALGV